MDEPQGNCHICGIDIPNESCSSSLEHYGMWMTYVNGNGKRRLYCLACIAQALHVFTMIKPEMMKYLEHDLKREVRELEGELARRKTDVGDYRLRDDAAPPSDPFGEA